MRLVRRNASLMVFFVGLFVLDRVTKQWALHLESEAVNVSDWFVLRLVKNPGAAFGVIITQPILLLVTIVLLGWLVKLMAEHYRRKQLWEFTLLGAVMVGAVGNLGDRLLYQGAVIDFIKIGSWPVFNLADVYITIGVVLLLVSMLHKRKAVAGAP